MSNEDWNELDESYRSALSGALETAHPVVEQAGGDERAACNRWIAEQQLCQGSDISLFKLERNGALVSLHELLRDAYQAGQARAALAQPSPAQAEAERPEVVGYLATAEHPKHGQPHKAFNYFKDQHDAQVAHWRERGCEVSEDELMTVTQHARIVGALRAERDGAIKLLGQSVWQKIQLLTQERDAANARLHEVATACATAEQQRDAALARVEELERQEPVATVAKVPGEDWNSLDFHRDLQHMQPGTKLYAAPVAQAQQLHDLDKQCRDDVARALGLRPNQERGFAWSYLLASIKSCVKASEDSAQAQHSVPEEFIGRLSEFLAQRGTTGKALLRELRAMLAAAPGKEGV